MLVGLCVVILAMLTWAVTSSAARPARVDARDVAGPRLRDLDRRRAELCAFPDRATARDLVSLLSAEGVDALAVGRVEASAAAGRLSARTLWCLADRFGGARCVLAVDADVAERSLRRHLDAGTVPDWRAMAIFADLIADSSPGSMPHQEVLDLDAVIDVGDLAFPPDLNDWSTPGGGVSTDIGAFSDLPPIAGPANLSGHQPQPETPPDRRPRRRNHRGWPLAS